MHDYLRYYLFGQLQRRKHVSPARKRRNRIARKRTKDQKENRRDNIRRDNEGRCISPTTPLDVSAMKDVTPPRTTRLLTDGTSVKHETTSAERGKRVLVADDESYYRDPLEHFFKERGYIVDLSGTYDETRQKINTSQYDLIVCDNKMPVAEGSRELSGVGLQLMAHATLGLNAKTPFILNTGDDTQKTIDTVKKLRGIYRNKHDPHPLSELLKEILE